MVKIRLKYSKVCNSEPKAECWYCKSSTNKVLILLDGSEVWCCNRCAKKKRFVRRHNISQQELQSYKKFGITREENEVGQLRDEGVCVNGF